MLKLGRVTKINVLFLALVFAFNFDLLKFSTAILEKGLLREYFFLGKLPAHFLKEIFIHGQLLF